ncbi:UDP-N- acetylglucosamine 4 FFFD epimerase [Carpediemonas membranifera]|uniref:UDP-N- acetylglucosamine 4 FFFD epimerase n=1 Tax=Carpediemonas membranifera TaxID=201153 RepID=A0A8J6B3R4_9EUKA|nr:UDP-N- acetylglucosamine 4 FFFD epimerase [Carpediemonas membranifera]|eukprot:KAG9392312.1 UDP-N- acetylglucosamine 4 FFFD epimerase [Carpediemonas membranifera]
MKVLVTGGAGFIGSHVCEHMLRDGHTVIVFDNLSSGKLSNIDGLFNQYPISFIKGDITSETDLQLIPACDAVVHLAAAISVIESMSNPRKYEETNVEGSRKVYEWAKSHGATTIVSASSAAVYGDAPPPLDESAANGGLSPYAQTKFEMEKVGRQFESLKCHYLRFFNVYGPRQDPTSPYTGAISIFMDRSTTNRDITVFGDGEQTRDFVSVSDVAAAIKMLITTPDLERQTLNVGTSSTISINELVDIILVITGSKSKVAHGDERAGEIKHSCANTDAIRRLGWAPNVELREGLGELVEWFVGQQ